MSRFFFALFHQHQYFFSLKADIELGLKKDGLGPLDGSSLEALLKGEPMDKRVAPELRGPEEDQNLADITGTAGASSHSGSTRVRKVYT